MKEEDLLFLRSLLLARMTDTALEGRESVFQIVQVKTAMLPDFSGIQKVEHFTGAIFLTREAAEVFRAKAEKELDNHGATLEVRSFPLTACPDLRYLLDIVKKMMPGI